MNKTEMFKLVIELPFDKDTIVCEEEGTQVYISRPSKLSNRFKNYNLKKNFQVWLKKEGRTFRPNHLQVFIDLNLRTRSRPDLKKELLLAFDNIFYGKDPTKELEKLKAEEFEHSLNPLIIIGVLSQLFIIEQEYNYNRPSKFDPPTLFYQGWIRQFIDSPKEIDNLCMSVAKGQPPVAKYVNLENKKDKKYVENLKPLWYILEENKKLI